MERGSPLWSEFSALSPEMTRGGATVCTPLPTLPCSTSALNHSFHRGLDGCHFRLCGPRVVSFPTFSSWTVGWIWPMGGSCPLLPPMSGTALSPQRHLLSSCPCAPLMRHLPRAGGLPQPQRSWGDPKVSARVPAGRLLAEHTALARIPALSLTGCVPVGK